MSIRIESPRTVTISSIDWREIAKRWPLTPTTIVEMI